MFRLCVTLAHMKNIIALTSFLAFGSFANAQEAVAAEKCPASKCSASKCNAGTCDDDCCGAMVKLAVTGLEKEGAAETAQITIGAMAGINHCSACANSGTVMIKYDSEKMKVADIEKAVAKNGLKVTGHKTSFNVKGLACQSCSNHLTAVLGKTDGVVNVDKVCHMSGHAAVTFDPAKTDEEKIKAAIQTTKYKVVEAKKEAPAAAPQS